jgi:glycosyltransferase involved in cell wall biosynthesis
MPKVSVIVPTHNGLKYLPETIDSILNQTFQDFELIIVDNGSTDGTDEWVKSLDNPKVKYHWQEDSGCPAGSRNTGLKLVQGEFIAFLDADDIWMPEKLEKQIKLFDNPAVGLVYSGAAYIDGDGNHLPDKKKNYYRGDVLCRLLKTNVITTSTVIVKRNLIIDNDFCFRSGRKGTEDWDLWLRLAKLSEFDYVDELLIKYRIFPASISRNADLMFKSAKTTLEDFQKELDAGAEDYKRIMKASNLGLAHHEFHYALQFLKNGNIANVISMLFLAFRHRMF